MSASATPKSCAYCQLPLGPSAGTYCCSGCRFAAAVAADQGVEGGARRTLMRLGLGIFFAMNVMVFTLAMWTQDVYGEASLASPQAQTLWELFRYLSLLFAGPVMILLGMPLLEHAAESCRRLFSTTDSLILLGVGAAYLYSVIAVFTGNRHTYFEVACMVLVGVTLGRWLEATGRQKASEALRSLKQLLPKTVRLVDPRDLRHAGNEMPLENVTVGQWFRVLPGERIALDGIIQRGQAAIDQQLVTGESQPAIKETGDQVFAGTVNLDGDLSIVVLETANSGMLQRIIDAVEQAALAKSRLQGLADRIASWFVPAVGLLAVVMFAVRFYHQGFGEALMAGLAILLIACPCALGIATPMALHAALGVAARRGILFRNGDVLERLAGTNTFCFDKTGTLTTGEAAVHALLVADQADRSEVLRVACDLSAASIHGLSQAIYQYIVSHEEPPETVDELFIESRPGRGLVAGEKGKPLEYFLGNARLMQEHGLATPPTLESAIAEAAAEGMPVVFVGWAGQVRGMFTFVEQLRPEAEPMLRTLLQTKRQAVVLTGDYTARSVTNLPDLEVIAQTRLLPEDKREFLANLKRQGKSVAMIGDGINDAPALAEATVGIAMGCGADVSRDAADLCLLGNDLSQIPWVVELSRRTLRTIRQNLFWAFAYNVIGIGLAVGGILNPIWAAIAMVGSSLFVTTNSLRLANFATEQVEAIQPSATELAAAATTPATHTLS